MDAFVRRIEQLSDMAAQRPDPRPLDSALVMSRLHGLDCRMDDEVLSLPLRFWAGAAAMAAAVAVGVTTLASTAWMEMSSPMMAVDSLLNAMP